MSSDYFAAVERAVLSTEDAVRGLPLLVGPEREKALKDLTAARQALSEEIEFLLSEPPPRFRPQYWRVGPSGVTTGPFGANTWAREIQTTLRQLDRAGGNLLATARNALSPPLKPPRAIKFCQEIRDQADKTHRDHLDVEQEMARLLNTLANLHECIADQWEKESVIPTWPAQPSGLPKPEEQTRLQIDGGRVYLDGEHVPLEGMAAETRPDAIRYLCVLLTTHKEWLSDREAREEDKNLPNRVDLLRKKLPAPVRVLIETNKRKGSRLKPENWLRR